jgi:hypothetical protein
MTSFQRQLNLYGFRRRLRGEDKGAYYHQDFLRNLRNRCLTIKRKVQKLKIPPHFLSQKPAPLFRESSAAAAPSDPSPASAGLSKPLGLANPTCRRKLPSGANQWAAMLSIDARLATASRAAMLQQQLALSDFNQIGPRR